MKQLKTPMQTNENIVVPPQIGTLMTGARENGYLAITNQRIIWEKATAMNVLGRGIIGIAASATLDFHGCNIDDIENIEEAKGQFMASGLQIRLKNGETYHFSLSGSKHKAVRDQIIRYVAQQAGCVKQSL